MYGKNKDTIIFPDLIPGNVLGGIEHTMRVKFSGIKPIGAFGYTTNTFFGGRSEILYFIPEYGFYACKANHEEKIIGFYADDPYIITDIGKKLIREYYMSKDVLFIKKGDVVISEEEYKERELALNEAVALGIELEVVSTMTARQINSLIKVLSAKNPEVPKTKPDESEEPKVVTKLPTRGKVKA